LLIAAEVALTALSSCAAPPTPSLRPHWLPHAVAGAVLPLLARDASQHVQLLGAALLSFVGDA